MVIQRSETERKPGASAETQRAPSPHAESRRPGSNRKPSLYKSDALPIELRRLGLRIVPSRCQADADMTSGGITTRALRAAGASSAPVRSAGRRGGQTCRRPRPRARDLPVRRRARAQQRRRSDGRRGRAAARARAAHRQHQDRPAELGGAAVGAVFVLPVGMLVDRVKRMPMLSASIVLWSVASLASGFAGSYGTLLLTRLALGAVIATAGPAIASLTGDYFPARERGRIYAYILGGEIAGTAVGLHRQRHGRQRDLLARGVRAARDPRLLPRAIAVAHGARAAARRPEPAAAGDARPARGRRRAPARRRRIREHRRRRAAPAEVDELSREAARARGLRPDPQLVLHRGSARRWAPCGRSATSSRSRPTCC